jgi:biopolymer transport protein ExbB
MIDPSSLPDLPALLAQDAPRAVSLAEAFFIQRNGRTGGVELFGTLIIWILIAASVASIALIALRHRENRREHIHDPGAAEECASLIAAGELQRAEKRARQSETDLGAMLAAAIADRRAAGKNADPDAALRTLDQSAESLIARRLRRIEPLNIIGTVSPMLGLFGTVYGMILAFREIVAAGGAPDPVGLAAGIGTALTTTFWGLIVAIPALIGFGVLRNTIDAHTADAEQAAQRALTAREPAEKP